MIKNNKGSTIVTTPVIIAIGMILISILIVFTIKILMPYIWYEKLSSTCIKYIFVMEDYGYLTKTEKKNLINYWEIMIYRFIQRILMNWKKNRNRACNKSLHALISLINFKYLFQHMQKSLLYVSPRF